MFSQQSDPFREIEGAFNHFMESIGVSDTAALVIAMGTIGISLFCLFLSIFRKLKRSR